MPRSALRCNHPSNWSDRVGKGQQPPFPGWNGYSFSLPLEHDAEKCERFSHDSMLSLSNVEQDSDFTPTRPKIIRFWPQSSLSIWRRDGHRRWAPCPWFLHG
ncbi:hypothetical protein CO657_21395 [Rhizobium acidisoli]|uniref:Uncharacterized protein n=1 Tax=Rhizobium acidisoli TaxID=1538158 RepID=A0AAE5TZZ2_9HYPH|nr:hypothetical protein CO657_21395 [Rhizobium acidisoli]